MSSPRRNRACLAALTLCALGASLLSIAPARADQNSDDANRRLVNQVCAACHGLAPIQATRNGVGGWRGTVFDMVDKGAQIQSQAQLDSIVNYLATAYGPSAGPMHTGTLPVDRGAQPVATSDATAADYQAMLPAAKGADLVKGYCSICHDLGRIVATRRSADEWRRYTAVMLARIGAPPSKQVSDTIAAYLSSNFSAPEQTSR